MSSCLQHHGLKHSRVPCPSPTLGACLNSCPWSPWHHPTILSSVILFYCPQSFPASGSFPMCQFFTLGGQSIRDSASASVFPMNIQDRSPLKLTGLISWSPCSPRDPQESPPTPQPKSNNSPALSPLYPYIHTWLLVHDYCSNSCPLSQWCHPTILSSVTPFSSCLQSFPASGSFPMSQLFTQTSHDSMSLLPN